MISNRAFQANSSENASLDPWFASGDAQLQLVTSDRAPLSAALPYSVNVSGTNGQVGLSNPGFWGIDVRPQTYTGQFWLKGDYNGKFTAALHSNLTDEVFGTASIPVSSKASDGWVNFNYTLEPTQAASNSNNTFTLSFDAESASSSLQLNLISLFPPTYNNRPNGNRIDLMQTLKNLSPSYLRFPGGNNLEGDMNTVSFLVFSIMAAISALKLILSDRGTTGNGMRRSVHSHNAQAAMAFGVTVSCFTLCLHLIPRHSGVGSLHTFRVLIAASKGFSWRITDAECIL